jgi:hypothetical protein
MVTSRIGAVSGLLLMSQSVHAAPDRSTAEQAPDPVSVAVDDEGGASYVRLPGLAANTLGNRRSIVQTRLPALVGAGIVIPLSRFAVALRYRLAAAEQLTIHRLGPEMQYHLRAEEVDAYGFVGVGFTTGFLYDSIEEVWFAGFDPQLGVGIEQTLSDAARIGIRLAGETLWLYRLTSSDKFADGSTVALGATLTCVASFDL